MQVLRIFPVVVPFSGQKPIGVELIGVSPEHLDGFGAIVVGHETDFRPADLLVSEGSRSFNLISSLIST